jgi:hypothetical protein
LVPPDALWCDKFDMEIIPKRDAPYLIEGVWLNESGEGPNMRFFPGGTTEDEQVHWRIENAKYLRITGDEPQLFFTYRRAGAYCIVKALSVDQFVMTVTDLNSEVTYIKKTPKNPDWALRPLTPEEIADVKRRVSALAPPLTERDFLDALPELDFNGRTLSFKDDDADRLVWKKWQERFEVRLRVQGEKGERRILAVAVLGPFDEKNPPPPASDAFADCPITDPQAEAITVRMLNDRRCEKLYYRVFPLRGSAAPVRTAPKIHRANCRGFSVAPGCMRHTMCCCCATRTSWVRTAARRKSGTSQLG